MNGPDRQKKWSRPREATCRTWFDKLPAHPAVTLAKQLIDEDGREKFSISARISSDWTISAIFRKRTGLCVDVKAPQRA